MEQNKKTIYVCTLASDWDDDRCYVETEICTTITDARKWLADKKQKCIQSFGDEEEYVIEELKETNAYLAYLGTEDEADISFGWEYAEIQAKDIDID